MTEDLVITLRGGSSRPLCEVAQIIHDALAEKGFQVLVDIPEEPTDEWTYGWDGMLEDESVVIRYDRGQSDANV